VAGHRLSSLLHLADDAIGLGWDFGFGSLEALAWVALTIQRSVYVPGSLVRTATGFRFALANPPLRIGAFSSVRLRVDGDLLPAERVRVRVVPGGTWRVTSDLGLEHPLTLQGGVGAEFDADWPVERPHHPMVVRLELQNVAIPPLVWMEFRETPGEIAPP
jgi:hypothetical protein